MISPMESLARLQIGTVDFVAPDEVKVLLDLDAPQSMAMNAGKPRPFPRINGFVLLPTENGFIVGQITWLAIEHSSFPKRKGIQDFGLIDLPFPLRKMSLSLLGTLVNESNQENTKYKFKRGVHTFPGLGDPVIIPDSIQLKAIVESGTDGRVLIGHCPLADNAEVRVNPDKIFGRHLAILGNTGSGKSCSVAGLIHWSLAEAKKLSGDKNPNARFLVIDPNGEYSGAFDNHKARVFKVEPDDTTNELLLNVPAWLWNSSEWSAFTQASGRAQKPLLRRALREVRCGIEEDEHSDDFRLRRRLSSAVIMLKSEVRAGNNYEGWKFSPKLVALSEDLQAWMEEHAAHAVELHVNNETVQNVLQSKSRPTKPPQYIQYYNDFSQTDIESIISSINSTLNSLGGLVFQSGPSEDAPLPFKSTDFIDHIETLAEQETNPQFFDYLVMRIRMMLSDKRMLSVSGNNRELSLNQWLEEFVGSSDASNGCVSVIDLSLVPQEIVHIVTAVVSRLTFEALQRYRRNHPDNKVLPTSLVMEEAHNFIKNYRNDSDEASASSMCCQVFEKIAREGRKFGLGLVLSSQRPSELSSIVLSQCNTFLLHRITNDKDQEMVARLLPDGIRGLIREIPALPSQHAFLVGWAAELPILTRMLSLPERQRPHSDDPDYWNVWTRTNSQGEPEERHVDWKAISDEWQEVEVNEHIEEKNNDE
ncbi:TPA: ATP-binding protein [Vibrio cholerae]|nr:ATP-binding protein [Vibrio cholerae]EGR2491301.1 ATP-binding protein [Vibrio cholerae]EGR4169771.1 ATP-binding protein [Vibrio cholerae]EGR4170411.1 ATP-binding protein [Vibrio cholerae]